MARNFFNAKRKQDIHVIHVALMSTCALYIDRLRTAMCEVSAAVNDIRVHVRPVTSGLSSILFY